MLNKKEEIINKKFGVPAARAHFYCPVGRGDPTPPGEFAVAAKLQGGVKTPPYK